MIVFAGLAANGSALDDVWALTCAPTPAPMDHPDVYPTHKRETCSWERLCDGTSCGPGPGPRAGATLVHVGGSLLLFGGFRPGENTTTQYLGDVWHLSLAASASPRWQSLCSPHSACGNYTPTPRAGHVAVNVEGLTMLIHGGSTAAGIVGDAWVFRLDATLSGGGGWTPLRQTGGPPNLTGHTAVLLGTNEQRVVLFGGRSPDGTPMFDVWSAHRSPPPAFLGEWIHLCGPTASCDVLPPPRARHTAIAHQDTMTIFGGEGGAANASQSFADLWQFRDSGISLSWSPLCAGPVGAPTPCGEGPLPRSAHSAVVFPDGFSVIFGGMSDGEPPEYFQDVWQLGSTSPASPVVPGGPAHKNHLVLFLPMLFGVGLLMSLLIGIAYNVMIARRRGPSVVPHFQWCGLLCARMARRLAQLCGGRTMNADDNPLLRGDPDMDPHDWTDFDVDDEANYL